MTTLIFFLAVLVTLPLVILTLATVFESTPLVKKHEKFLEKLSGIVDRVTNIIWVIIILMIFLYFVIMFVVSL